MQRLPFVILLLLIVVLPGCDVFSPDERAVSVYVFGDDVYVFNNTEARIYHVIVGHETSTLIDWIPHLNDAQSIAPGKTVRLHLKDDILGTAGEKELVVNWWHAVERDGERTMGELHWFMVTL